MSGSGCIWWYRVEPCENIQCGNYPNQLLSIAYSVVKHRSISDTFARNKQHIDINKCFQPIQENLPNRDTPRIKAQRVVAVTVHLVNHPIYERII